jgi:hypothetical protein
MSRAFDGVDDRWSVLVGGVGVVVGARVSDRRRFRGIVSEWEGRSRPARQGRPEGEP